LPSLSTQNLDMYFKVVKKNNEEKNNSTLYLLVSSGNENFASPKRDTALWNSSKMFLNSFVEKTVAYNLEQNITAQENNGRYDYIMVCFKFSDQHSDNHGDNNGID